MKTLQKIVMQTFVKILMDIKLSNLLNVLFCKSCSPLYSQPLLQQSKTEIGDFKIRKTAIWINYNWSFNFFRAKYILSSTSDFFSSLELSNLFIWDSNQDSISYSVNGVSEAHFYVKINNLTKHKIMYYLLFLMWRFWRRRQSNLIELFSNYCHYVIWLAVQFESISIIVMTPLSNTNTLRD